MHTASRLRPRFLPALIFFTALLSAGHADPETFGVADPDFNTATDELIYAAIVQPDDRILIGGNFTTVGNDTRRNVARLHADGTLDPTFGGDGTGVVHANGGATIYALALQPDGKVLVAGRFTHFNDVEGNCIVRLFPDGTVDPSFNSTLDYAWIRCLALLPDGRVLVAGYQASGDNHISRLNTDGTLDEGFAATTGGPLAAISSVALQPDGRILIAGDFLSAHGATRHHLARLEADGALDPTFLAESSHTGADSRVETIAVQPDGKIVVGGYFSSIHDTPRARLARLEPDGSLDTSFEASADSLVKVLRVQRDGKILVGGLFETLNNVARGRMGRLNPDGSVDETFLAWPVTGAPTISSGEGGINAIAAQDDGRLVLGGGFATFNATAHANLVRLTAEPPTPVVVSIAPADVATTSAPTAAFTVTFSHRVTGVDAGDFHLVSDDINGAVITDVSGSDRTYTVTVSTGQGEGLLGLELIDDDSIVSVAAAIPLGGVDAANGNFTAGERITIVPPFVRLIHRLSPSGVLLTSAARELVFRVSFSEPVNDVDVDDFALLTNDGIEASIEAVSAAHGTFFTVTVAIDGGDGGVRLDLRSDATIEDDAGNPTQAGYTAGQFYGRIPGTTAFAWGQNGDNGDDAPFSQLGNNRTGEENKPVFVDTSAASALRGKTVIALANGNNHSLALDADGKVYAWGKNEYGQLGFDADDVPGTLVPTALPSDSVLADKTIVAIAAGYGHSLALDSEGKVYAWGLNNFRQLGVGSTAPHVATPTAVIDNGVLAGKTIVAIAGGSFRSLALDVDGRIYAWGSGTNGELGDGSSGTAATPVATLMSGAFADKPAIAIATSDSHSIALAADGTVYTWGSNSHGELGNDGALDAQQFSPVPVVTSGALRGKIVTAIATGSGFNLALDSDGKVYSWGSNGQGVLGNNSPNYALFRAPVAVNTAADLSALHDKKVTAIAAGVWTAHALTADGVIAAWGANSNGGLGDGGSDAHSVPTFVDSSPASALRGAVPVAFGTSNNNQHTLVVALSFGPIVESVTVPEAGAYKLGDTLTFTVTFNRAVTVTGTPRLILDFNDGALYADYVSSSSDDLTLTFRYTVQDHDFMPNGIRLAAYIDLAGGTILDAAGEHAPATLAFAAPLLDEVRVDGTIPALISIVRSAGAPPSQGLDLAFFDVAFTEPVNIEGDDLEADDFLFVSTNGVTGTIAGVRRLENPFGETRRASRGIAFARESSPASAIYRVMLSDLAGEGDFHLELKPGRGLADEAGNLLSTDAVADVQSYRRFEHSLPLLWGAGDRGQLGNEDDADASSPVAPIMDHALDGKTVVALAHGRDHTLALTADGKVFAWGNNEHEQLGFDTDDSFTTVPTAVDASSDHGSALADAFVIAIAAGDGFSVALTAEGNVVTWGRNDHGELGNDYPHEVRSVPDLVSAFPDHDGGDARRPSPRLTTLSLPERPRIVAIAAGANHVLALAETGVLYAWGLNEQSELGFQDNDDSSRSVAASLREARLQLRRDLETERVPVRVDLDEPIFAISAGAHHNLALDREGDLYAWGENASGELGYGPGSPESYPLPVSFPSSDIRVRAIAAGGAFSLALDDEGRAYSWGANDLGQLARETTHQHQEVSPKPIALDETFVSLATGEIHALALASDGAVHAWGSNDSYQLADDTLEFTASPQRVALPEPNTAHVLGLGSSARHSGVVAAVETGPVAATVSLSSLSATYDGSTHPVSVSTSPSGLDVSVTYNGSASPPVNAGSYAVVATITSEGYAGSATGTLVIARASQTITFPPTTGSLPANQPITLAATASSGLPVAFTVVSGPAILSGSQLSFQNAGTVVVRASQAGNANYAAAPNVANNFTVTLVKGRVFFGSATIQTSSIPGQGRTFATSSGGEVAATVSADGRSGTLLIVAPAAGINDLISFSIAADGTFSLSTTQHTGSTTRSLSGSGQLAGETLSGSFPAIGFSFSATVEPFTGSSASIDGLYISSALNTSQGTVYSIVGSNNNVLVLVVTPHATVGGTASLASDGTFAFSATVDGGTLNLSGKLNSTTTTLTGSLTLPGVGVIDLAGLNTGTPRTDRLINLSARARVGTGENLAIAGFVIAGTQPKQVLVRAVGPALAEAGVADTLANPHLRLVRDNQTVAENEDWGASANASTLATTFARVGASALPATSTDAALLVTLTPGVYTAHVTGGAAAPEGVAIVEIYDASEAPGAEVQRLVNLSARAHVAPGENVLIGGFVIEGNTPKRVLLRAVGPGLVAGGVGAPLADPRLQVYHGSTALAANDDWSADSVVAAEIAAATTAVNTPPLASGSKDAALVLTLAPGLYTVHVAGAADSSGVALVEIYEIPE